MRVRQWIERISYATLNLSVWLTASSAFAGGTDTLPWTGSLTTITNDLTGPTSHAVVTTAAVLGGLSWAHSEHVRHVGA
jgi:type IV secretory pathway VirB2 component (pilin)